MRRIVSGAMRLTLDLRGNPSPAVAAPGERIVTLGELAATVRRPVALSRLLWGRRWEELRVLQDDGPASGVQGGALALAGLARAGAYVVERPTAHRSLRRSRFLAGALPAAGSAVARELVRSATLARRAAVVAATKFPTAPVRGRPGSIAYLRAEPSLRWMGAERRGRGDAHGGGDQRVRANGVDVHVYAPERPAGADGVPVIAVPRARSSSSSTGCTLLDHSDHARARRAGPARRRRLPALCARLLRRPRARPAPGRAADPRVQRLGDLGRAALGRRPRAARRTLQRPGAAQPRATRALVVVVSDVLRDQLLAEGMDPARVLVNPNGVDVDALADVRAASPEHGGTASAVPEAPTVGFIGTFGLLARRRAAARARRGRALAEPDARAGTSSATGRCGGRSSPSSSGAGTADRVLAPGLVPHEQATRLLGACDVCVSPHVPNPDGTPFFGSPTKLFEYMGLAQPIVASDLDQIGEVIEHEQTGLLVPPGDVQRTADAIVRLLRDAALRTRLGAAALARARERHGWEAHVRRILDAVESLA